MRMKSLAIFAFGTCSSPSIARKRQPYPAHTRAQTVPAFPVCTLDRPRTTFRFVEPDSGGGPSQRINGAVLSLNGAGRGPTSRDLCRQRQSASRALCPGREAPADLSSRSSRVRRISRLGPSGRGAPDSSRRVDEELLRYYIDRDVWVHVDVRWRPHRTILIELLAHVLMPAETLKSAHLYSNARGHVVGIDSRAVARRRWTARQGGVDPRE